MERQDTLYCFSCGRPVPAGQAVPFCSVCTSAGPQVTGKALRWVVRGQGSLPRGSLAREEVVALLVKEVMGEDAEVAREGGAWQPLIEHPDFRGIFLPGSTQNLEFEAMRKGNRTEQRSIQTRRTSRFVVAAALMLGSVGLAAYSAQTGLLTVPESVTDTVSGWFGSVTETVGENVAVGREVDPDSVERALPGGELLTMLPPLARDEPVPFLLQSGWAAWWTGTDAGLAEAREAFESAVTKAPEDVEALGGLIEVYTEQVHGEPALRDAIAHGLARMVALEPEAIATLRARAADARASGSDALVVGILASCGAPVSKLYDAVDLNCAMRLAESRGDDSTLAILVERSGSQRILMSRTRAAVAQEDWPLALGLSRQLVQQAGSEAESWSLSAQSNAAVGDWRSTASAAAEATRRAPHRLELAHLRAQIQIRVLGEHRDALTALKGIIASPHFEQYPERLRVFNDAAEAALVLGQADAAKTHISGALTLDQSDPIALLQQGWIFARNGDAVNAEESLRRIDASGLRGSAGAELHLGVALVYLSLNNQRSAVDELENAQSLDPTLVSASLAAALADIRVNNLDGAVEKVTRAPLQDAVYRKSLSPLTSSWRPPQDVARLKAEMGTALSNDVRYSVRLKEILAILDWYGGASTAEVGLREAVKEGGTVGTSAALAQELFATSRPGEALRFVEEVLNTEADEPIFLAMRAYAQAVTGDMGAERTLGRALQLEPMNPVILHWAASTYEVLGKKEEAIESLGTLLTTSPADVTARARLVSLSEE